MGGKCTGYEPKFDGMSRAYKRVMWGVIAINGAMFFVEMGAGLWAGSQALKADALDFFGDTATYALSLFVIGLSIQWRARAALFKGLCLAAFACWILGSTVYQALVLDIPQAFVMGSVGLLALGANVICVLLLIPFRDGDANVRSVWLCSRNDALGNLAVVLAASSVWATNSGWPDLIVAAVLAGLFLSSAYQIIRDARRELHLAATTVAAAE